MAKKSVPTIWRIPDDLWDEFRKALPPEKKAHTVGRPAVPYRKVLDGILYCLRTGCQWKKISREYGSGSTRHSRFQQWTKLEAFSKVWRRLLKKYDAAKSIGWNWQSLDSSAVKAPLGGKNSGPNPTDRAKLGTKCHTLVDRRGVPLSGVISGANRHDMKSAFLTLDGMVIKRPRKKQNICLDKGYDFPEIDCGVGLRGYVGHIRCKGEKAVRKKTHAAKRWVVERTASWHNRFRKLLVRFEKKDQNYLGLVQFANCIITYRAIHW